MAATGMKKKVAIVAAVLAALLALTLLLSNLDIVEDSEYDDWLENGGGRDSGEVIFFYPADWTTDIFSLPLYLQKDRGLWHGNYSDASIEAQYLEAEKGESSWAALGAEYGFFFRYFDAVTRGDHGALNAMFTDDYWEESERTPYADFPMQKLYDKRVYRFAYNDKNYQAPSGYRVSYFLVSYKIMQNDGLFRDDLSSGSELPQLFRLLSASDGTVKIDLVRSLPGFSLT